MDNRLSDTEECISDLEDTVMEITQLENKKILMKTILEILG